MDPSSIPPELRRFLRQRDLRVGRVIGKKSYSQKVVKRQKDKAKMKAWQKISQGNAVGTA